MNVLYLAKRSNRDIGSIHHLNMLFDIYGRENVFVIDLLSDKKVFSNNYYSFGYNRKKYILRLIRAFEGNIPNISNRMIRVITKVFVEKDIDLVFSEESDLGNLFKRFKKTKPSIQIVTFFHDISADLFRERLNKASNINFLYKMECRNTIKQEKVALRYSNCNIVFHEVDSKRFEKNYGFKPNALIPLTSKKVTLTNDYLTSFSEKDSKKCVLFVCSKYYVNIDGIEWFTKNVFDVINHNCYLVIVGDGSSLASDRISPNDRIEYIGKVDSVDEFYKKADIVIAPVFDGGGMKVKTSEALSFGKCFVSTSESLNGYWEKMDETIKNQCVFCCDTKEEWINALNLLISKRIQKCHDNILSLLDSHFSYESVKSELKKVLDSCYVDSK